jgi:site-specific recombinase XerD
MGLELGHSEHRNADPADLVAAYLSWLKGEDRASTAEKYRPLLELFAGWTGDRAVGDIAARDIELDFLPRWRTGFEAFYGKQPSDNTKRNHNQALRSWFKWLDRFDYLLDGDGRSARNPMEKIETPKVKAKVRDWLRQDEVNDLVAACLKPHERFVTYWFPYCGTRVEEAQNVRLLDIDLSTSPGSILIRESKTNTGMRSIPIHPQLRPQITKRIAELREKGFTDPRTPILATRNGTAMSGQQLGQTLNRVSARTDIAKQVNPQMLRRTFGSILLNQGLPIEYVSDLLGHSSVAITQKYYAELLPKTTAAAFMAVVA